MNSVERVKALCKERRIPISKLEKDLGYANGYIGQLRKGVFPADRFSEIAKYLSVSEEYLLTGKEPEKKPTSLSESGPAYPPKYDLLTPENREIVDRLIAGLVENQSPD